ncbi:MAG: Asp-tRNA(Asn)/Glu-tRNA(Gln) amidotransferase subunit GatB [Chloroflexota bacterium]
MDYEVTIGLEVHAQILTASKMFCGCSAEYASAPPNTHVCPVCLGLPGALPVINRRAVELAMLTGLALNCSIRSGNIISRKNYFYADLPSGYQRSQYEDPLCVNGWVEIEGDAGPKRIGLTRVHIEEDTGKLTHAPDGSALVDYNRAGVPLMEIVSEPDIASPEEARRYFEKLRQILLWIGVNSGRLQEGALRCDANVSVRPRGQKNYGSKVEIKNINSFRFVEQALAYEIKRQIAELEAGRPIPQSTRGWDETKGETTLQRVKESSEDYRYFPEPDIPPLLIGEELIEKCRAELPELPDARRARFIAEYQLTPYDATTLTAERGVADYFEETVAAVRGVGATPKDAANWTTGELFRLLKETGESLDEVRGRFPPAYIAEVIDLLAKGTITRTTAKEVFEISFRSGQPPAQIVAERGLAVIGAGDALAALAREVIAANPKAVAEYRGGKQTAIKFLVGQIMKATKGQANPQAAQAALEEALSQ